MYMNENETINQFMEDPRDLKKLEHQSQDFDTLINNIVVIYFLNAIAQENGQNRERLGFG